MIGNSRSLLIAFGLALIVGLFALALTNTKPTFGGRASPSPVGSPVDGSPVASPVSDVMCPDASAYLAAIGPVLEPLVRADDPASLTADWAYFDPDTYTGGEWRAVSARYGAALAAWNGVNPPDWAEGWHRAVATELSLRTNASLAAATRGVYAMGAYTGAITAAREASVAALDELRSGCPATAAELEALYVSGAAMIITAPDA